MTKIITICGSSRFIDMVAVVGWLLEREENVIAMGMHLLPTWYAGEVTDHLAEHQGVARAMDALHLEKIAISDEVFIVDLDGYVGDSTKNEIRIAAKMGKTIRLFSEDPIGKLAMKAINAAGEKMAHGLDYDPLKLGVRFGAVKKDGMGGTSYMYCEMDRQVLGKRFVRAWCVNKEHHVEFDISSGQCKSHPGYKIELWMMEEFDNYNLAIAHIRDILEAR